MNAVGKQFPELPTVQHAESLIDDQQRAAALRLLNTQPDADLLAQMLGLTEQEPTP